jgi:hypothetical protein
MPPPANPDNDHSQLVLCVHDWDLKTASANLARNCNKNGAVLAHSIEADEALIWRSNARNHESNLGCSPEVVIGFVFRPCLASKKFYKIFQIPYHIESLDVCM